MSDFTSSGTVQLLGDFHFLRELDGITRGRRRDGPDDALFRSVEELGEAVWTEELEESADEFTAVVFPLVDQFRRLVGHLVH